MARFRNRTHSIIPLFAGLVVGSLVLGWLGIPMVSSEGMIVRSHLVAGDLPSVPEDPAWDKIPVMAIPLSGQVITRPVWPGSLTTAVHPAANAGANERTESTTGEFHGTITPATPMGSGTELMCRPGATSVARPLSLSASAA